MQKRAWTLLILIFSLLVSFPSTYFGENTVKDRDGAVRGDKATFESGTRWIYNDYREALAKGKETGKPVLVTLRCVPCLACAGFDGEVLNESSALAAILDQFICCRVITTNDLDLSLFQWDYDLSFSAFFFNGDGTLYGRFGSWAYQKDGTRKDVDGMKATLEGVLELHKAYPSNKANLAGKQAQPIGYKTPPDIPGLSGKYSNSLNWKGNVVQSCIHCHDVAGAIREEIRKQGKPVPDEWMFPFPQPESLGLQFADDGRARVSSVAPGSPAARASLREGDEILTMKGQPLVSIADFSWVLHNAAAKESIPLQVKRGRALENLQLDLTVGWRQVPDNTKRVGLWPMRMQVLGGMVLKTADDAARRQLGLENDKLGLRVDYLVTQGRQTSALRAGFKLGDIVIKVGGDSSRLTEHQLIAKLMRTEFSGTNVIFTVRRDGRELDLRIAMR